MKTAPFVAPGTHLLIDFYGASNLCDLDVIEKALRQAAAGCGATVLQVMLHPYGEGAGVTGVALLAESHISIHTWPETSYAAIDVFVCGNCDPRKAIPILQSFLNPVDCLVSSHKRGEKEHRHDVR